MVSDSLRAPGAVWMDNLHRREWNWTPEGDDEMALVRIVLILAVNTESVSSQVNGNVMFCEV